MRILIPGGAGYVGSVLVRMLLDEGHGVTVVDPMFFGETLPEHSRLSIIKEDVRKVFHYVQGQDWDAVIDLAAISNDPAGDLDLSETWAVNHKAAVRTAAWAKRSGIPAYVFASSCSVYGNTPGWCDETSPINPISVYSQAKAAAETDILALQDNNFHPVIARQATVFGVSPRMRFDLVINKFVADRFLGKEIIQYGDGTAWRPYIHVQDTASALWYLAQNAERGAGQVFNVGSTQENYQLEQLIEVIYMTIGHGFPSSIRPMKNPDTRSYLVSFYKLNAFGWQAQKGVRDGILDVWTALKNKEIDPTDPRTNTVEWYKCRGLGESAVEFVE